MNAPLISVGIPFFNCEKCLLNAIRSIFAQTFQDWELILVDDGSTDKSLDIAKSIDDPRVKVLPSDGKNRRLAARLNQIAQAARGAYLARMDADDLCHPERFAKQLEFFKVHPKVDVVGSSSCILDAQGQPSKKLIVAGAHEEIFKNKFKKGISVVHPSLIAKKQWWLRWPYDDSKLRTQDYELWLRSCRDSVFANLPDILYFTNEFLSFSIKKYAKSKHIGVKVLLKYGVNEIGWLAYYYALLRYVKTALFVMAQLVGLHKNLIKKRYEPLTWQEKEDVAKALNIIRSTEVPRNVI